MDIKNIKMLDVGRYSYDGKMVRVYKKDEVYKVVSDQFEDKEQTGIHEGVVKQWLNRKEPLCEVIEE